MAGHFCFIGVFCAWFIGFVNGGTCTYQRMQPAAILIYITMIGRAGKKAVEDGGVKQHTQRFVLFGGGPEAEEFF